MSSSKRMPFGVAVLVALAVGLSGCQDDEPATGTTAVSGVVTDDVGAPVSAATVTAVASSRAALTVSSVVAAQTTTTTGPDGSYSIQVPETVVDVMVAKDGYAGIVEKITVGPRRRGLPPRGLNFDLAGKPGGPLPRMDADGDGKIAQAEWKGPPDAFLKIDGDGDGSLTAAELETARQDRARNHPRHGKMDQDGDGKIARSEWLGPPAHFTEIDADADGVLTDAELAAAMARRRPPISAAGA